MKPHREDEKCERIANDAHVHYCPAAPEECKVIQPSSLVIDCGKK